MADNVKEIKTIVNIDTSQSEKSISDLRKELKQLRENLNNSTIGTEEFNKASQDLVNKQNEISKVMKSVKDSVAPAQGSIAEMRKQLSELKKAWVETGDATHRANLGQQVLELNNKLKLAESGVGDFRRNVGNYTESITSAFGSIGNVAKSAFTAISTSAKGSIPAINGVTSALTTLSVNPVALTITAIVLVVQQLIEAFKRSESATATLNKAMANLEPVMIVIQRAFDAIVDVVAEAIEQFTKFINFGLRNLDKIGQLFGQDWGLSEMFEQFTAQTQEIADIENQLNAQRRQNQKETAEYERQISELEIIRDNTAKSRLEREKANKDIQELQHKIGQSNYELKKKEYELIKKKNELTSSGTKDLQAENDAYVAMIQAQTELNRMLNKSSKKENTIAGTSSNSTSSTDDKEKWTEADEALLKLQNDLAETEKGTLEYYDVLIQLATAKANVASVRLENESEEQYRQRQIEATKELTDAYKELDEYYINQEQELTNQLLEEEKNRNDALNSELKDRLKSESEIAIEKYQSQLDAYIWYRDNLFQLQGETDEEFAKRQAEADNNILEAQKNIVKEQISLYTSYANSIGSLFGAIANLKEEQINRDLESGKISEREANKRFEATKKLQIAQATISTITGAIEAYMKAQATYPPPMGIIMGAINSATVMASGLANINKIKSTTLNSSSISSDNGSSSVQTPVTQEFVEGGSSRMISASESSDIMNTIETTETNKRVYVVESDITEKQNLSKVRIAETTF